MAAGIRDALNRLCGITSILPGLLVLYGCEKPTEPKAPVAPTNLQATAVSTSSINLTWTDNSDDEQGFVIERSLNASSGFSEIATVTTDETTYAVTDLSLGTTYYFRVCAYNSVGNSNYSNVSPVRIAYGSKINLPGSER